MRISDWSSEVCSSDLFTRGADSFKIEAGRDLEIHAKAGFVINEAALLYAKVGYANAKAEAKAVINGIEHEESDTGSGLRLGAGTEISLSDYWSLLAESRYTDYSTELPRNKVVVDRKSGV